MSEYWKSTPKIWCKHCQTFVRDTKLEKTNHDATPKHQGALKRFLRDLHRNQEQGEREKERAKAEVARLNGVVASSSASGGSSAGPSTGHIPRISGPRQSATAAQIIQQREQLSELGVAIPDEFRQEMAMVGDWQVTSERILEPQSEDNKSDAIGFGVRKRPAEDEEDQEAIEFKKGRWGSAYRTHPTNGGDEDGDLEALLSNATSKRKKEPATKVEAASAVTKNETKIHLKDGSDVEPSLGNIPIKSENSDDGRLSSIKTETADEQGSIAASPIFEDKDKSNSADQPAGGVMFKKRRVKNIRQK